MKSLLYVATLSLSLIAVNVVSGMYAAQAAPAIPDNSVTSPKIKDGEVKTPDIGIAAVSKDKLKPDAVKLVAVSRVSPTWTVQPGWSMVFGAGCNSTEMLTGGGFVSNPGAQRMQVSQSEPQGNTWVTTVTNDGSLAFIVRGYAMCAHLELGP